MNRLTTEEFIKRAKLVHGDKYDYSKVEYVNARAKVCIIFPGYGEFWQKPFDHLNGHNGIKYRKTKPCSSTNVFIEKARKVHGDKYDYSKVEYVNARTPVCIICPDHGEFWLAPYKHLNGRGCQICSKVAQILKKKSTTEDFIEKARKVHGDKYDYSKVDYKGNKTKVCIVCPEHGEFWITPNAHLSGQKCARCSMPNYNLTTEEFIEKANKIHNYEYNYSKAEYKGAHAKICIICPEHGEFWQTAHLHLAGSGCPSCRQSKLEREVRTLLVDNSIRFVEQKRFNWLGLQSLDFYLRDYNVAIECQGIQHYKPVTFFGGLERFKYTKKLDKVKYDLCLEHGVKILYFSDIEYDKNIYIDTNTLLSKIISE